MILAPTGASPAFVPLGNEFWGLDKQSGAWISTWGLGFWTLDKQSRAWRRLSRAFAPLSGAMTSNLRQSPHGVREVLWTPDIFLRLFPKRHVLRDPHKLAQNMISQIHLSMVDTDRPQNEPVFAWEKLEIPMTFGFDIGYPNRTPGGGLSPPS